MESLKMSDVFQLPVFYEHDPLSEVAKFSGWQGGGKLCKSAFLAFDDDDADAICHAINNHDRLVEENAELREALKHLIETSEGNEQQLNELLMCNDYGESEALCKARQLLNK